MREQPPLPTVVVRRPDPRPRLHLQDVGGEVHLFTGPPSPTDPYHLQILDPVPTTDSEVHVIAGDVVGIDIHYSASGNAYVRFEVS